MNESSAPRAKDGGVVTSVYKHAKRVGNLRITDRMALHSKHREVAKQNNKFQIRKRLSL